MALVIDGPKVLQAMAQSPAAFGYSEIGLDSLATNLIITIIKNKETKLSTIRTIYTSIGSDDFKLVVDHITGKDLSGITKRLDPKNAEIKTDDQSWHRNHILKLATSAAEPLVAAPRTTRVQKTPLVPGKPKTGDVMKSKALKPRATKTK
jgi:hypothetical protein